VGWRDHAHDAQTKDRKLHYLAQLHVLSESTKLICFAETSLSDQTTRVALYVIQ